MKYVMFEHAGSGNHGCEAIVRSTQKILGNAEYYLQSFNWNEDVEYGLNENVKQIICKDSVIDRNSMTGIRMRVQSRLNSKWDYDTLEMLERNKPLLIKNSVALSIGGDNYCYGGIVVSMREKLQAFQKKNIPTILWGCSIGTEQLYSETIEDLKKYALITARESLTEQVLADVGIIDNVVRCADPAFVLDIESVTYKQNIFANNEVIGINVSDFMGYYNAYPEATYNNIYRLIEYILEKTECHVALIPHVRQKENDDLDPCKSLCNAFSNSRVFCVEEKFNCMQLKDIISKCCVFVGCRTHSTIAAYSTCVPTLVVGYSIKAKGICKDIFGNYDDLLVDVRTFETDYDLTRKFAAFWERREELRMYLENMMPTYKEKAYVGKTALERITSVI